MPDIEISRAALGRLDELSKTGAFGIVYSAPDLTLPDVTGPLVVKLFLADSQPSTEVERLRRIVAWRNGLTPARRRELDSLSTWPVRIVTEGRKVAGIVMSRASERFFFDNVQTARGGGVKQTAVTIQSLIQDAAKTRGRGIPTPDDDDLISRLICCARLAQFIRLLHSEGIVYGDLSHGNVLVSAEPAPPAVLFIDCDVAYPMDSKHPNRQHGTVLWFSPEESAGAALDASTDIYKLCLAILRILVSGGNVSQMTKSARLVGVLDTPGVDLMSRGLGRNRDDRPTADEVYRYLLAEIDGRTEAPVIRRCEVTEPYLVVGASFDLLLEVDHATTITVGTPEGRTLNVPPAQARSALRISAVASGSYIVTASNSFGSVSAESAPVRVVRPPDLIAVHYPEPDIPTLDAGDMSALRRGLEAAEATSAQLTSPYEQLRRISRELEVYDGLYAPTQEIRDVMQLPDDLVPPMAPSVRYDPTVSPLMWPTMEEQPRQHRRLFTGLLSPHPLIRRLRPRTRRTEGTREEHR